MRRKMIAYTTTLVLLGAATAGLAQQSTSAAEGGWLTDPITGCQIWNSGAVTGEAGASWSGGCHEGKAVGRGTAIFWDKQGLEGRYDGDMFAGMAEGRGTAWVRDDGTPGYDRYEGSFAQGQPVGVVTITANSGYVFSGEFLEGDSHAVGELTTPEGWIVRGEIKDGKTIGSALVYYETEEGELYFGDAENNQKHGLGTLVSPDETSYIGEFVAGEPSGLGVFEDPAGNQFVGQFDGGAPNGVGTALDADGVAYQGRFVGGVPDGLILVTEIDGAQRTENWQQGSKVE